jgi:transcription-repair coupling factor (superfamily II helicase)
VRLLGGDAAEEAAEPVRLDLPVDAYVPGDYVPYEAAKIEVHRRVAGAREVAQLIMLREELVDRFGPLPDETERLFLHQTVRLLAGEAGIARIRPAEGGGLSLEAPPEHGALDRLVARGLPLRPLDAETAYFAPPKGAPASDRPAALLLSLRALAARLSTRT